MTLTGRDNADAYIHKISKAPPRHHPTYWFEDGSLIVQVQDVAYNVHKTLVTRHSSVLKRLTESEDGYDVSSVRIPDELGVLSQDFERLLEHLYHDIPLALDSQLPQLASILRVSSEQQLDFQDIHTTARRGFESLYSSTLEGLSHSPSADQALGLAIEYDIHPVQKGLFYSVVTHMHFEDDDPEPIMDKNGDGGSVPLAAVLSPDVIRHCKQLLDHLIAHFTPILFTVATAGHMTCTDVLAEMWMPQVIQPALENNGLCRPIETLQSIIDLDWSTLGLCEDCVVEKRKEWKGEQGIVWKKMDDWLPVRAQT